MNYANLIQYFRRCFEIDNRNIVINDIYKSSEYVHSLDKEELITEESPITPIPKNVFEDLKKLQIMHSGEGKLLYFSYLMRGETIFNNKKVKIFTPLFLFEATILQEGEFYYLKLQKNKPILNQKVFSDYLNNPDDGDFSDKAFQTLENPKDFRDIPILFDQYFSEIINTECMNFPKLKSESELLKIYKSRAKKYSNAPHLFPAGGICFLRDKSEVKGVLSELDHISKMDHHESSFKELFGPDKIKIHSTKNSIPYANLNASQTKAVENSNRYGLSYIIGPPGTGKSYSVAAIAIDHILQDKSVLIVSKTDEAVDVIREKIEKDYNLKSSVFRTGSKSYMKGTKELIDELINNYYSGYYGYEPISLHKELVELKKSIAKIQKSEGEFIDLSQKLKTLSEKYYTFEQGSGLKNKILFELLKLTFSSKNSIYRKLDDLHWEIDFNSKTTKDYIEKLLLQQKSELTRHHRSYLKDLKKSFSSRTASKREYLQEQIDYDILLDAFPIWMVKLKDIYKAIPLKQNLFDLVIIDEATQCDIASTIPILYRGKQAVIAGDPKQIRHISFVSKKKQYDLKKQFKIDDYKHLDEDYFNYRDHSIIDIISEKIDTSDQIAFLNEHFRSLPAIIDFSNKNFYADTLHIMTTKPELEPNEGLHFHHLNGIRNELGENEVEAQFIWSKIQEIVNDEAKLSKDFCSSIGVLSPFRKQTDLLGQQLLENFSIEIIEKHQIMVGTSYKFQGNERDTMFLSLTLDEHSHPSGFSYMNKTELLNVAITRARSNQHIVHSFNPKSISYKNRIRKYFEYYLTNRSPEKKNPFKDDFLEELSNSIENKVEEIWPSYSMSGILIDLLAKKDKKYFGFDLIGFPGEFEDIYSIDRYKILHRIGISIYPISYIEWRQNKEKVMDSIEKFFFN